MILRLRNSETDLSPQPLPRYSTPHSAPVSSHGGDDEHEGFRFCPRPAFGRGCRPRRCRLAPGHPGKRSTHRRRDRGDGRCARCLRSRRSASNAGRPSSNALGGSTSPPPATTCSNRSPASGSCGSSPASGSWSRRGARFRNFVNVDLDPNRVYSVMVEVPPAGAVDALRPHRNDRHSIV